MSARCVALAAGAVLLSLGCEEPAANSGQNDTGGGQFTFQDTSPPSDAPDVQTAPDPGNVSDPGPDSGPDLIESGPDVPETPDPGPVQEDPGPPVPCANDGTACNDNNPCTVNDQCVGGTCQGQAVDCNDNVPCTDDQCIDGSCQHPVSAGFCFIGGTCYSDGNKNPTNTCQRCTAANPSIWSSATGACDDGNPCTVDDYCSAAGCTPGSMLDNDNDGEAPLSCGGFDCNDNSNAVGPGKAEICTDQLDNDCDGDTDSEDDSCGNIGLPCSYHADCHPDAVCARWYVTNEPVCSQQCAGSTDCPSGYTCSKLPGSAHIGFCEQAAPGGLPVGSDCSGGQPCFEGLCIDGACRGMCVNDSHCGLPGHTCGWVGNAEVGLYGACLPNSTGGILNGQPCTLDGVTYGGEFCMSGLCDLALASPSTWTCTPVCTSEYGCQPAQECNIMAYSPATNPLYMPYHPQFTQPTHDAVAGCYSLATGGGFLADGQQCTSPAQCASNKCLQLIPGDPSSYCTSFCAYDAECVPGMNCVLEALSITSAWLNDPENGSQNPAPNSRTLVQVCKP